MSSLPFCFKKSSGNVFENLKRKFYKLQKRNLKTKMILQVHDELIFDCVKEEKEEVTNLVTDIMNNICELSVPLRVDIEYGDNWYNAK
jgi:DNA polymerase-1